MRKSRLILLLTFLIGLAHGSYAHKLTASPSVRLIKAGKASWYSKNSPKVNKRTANNEIFNDQDLTCAIWGVEFNRKIKVTNRSTGKSIVVRVNDRGPHARYVRKGRIIDLTLEAFKKLGTPKDGLLDVEIELL